MSDKVFPSLAPSAFPQEVQDVIRDAFKWEMPWQRSGLQCQVSFLLCLSQAAADWRLDGTPLGVAEANRNC